MEGASITMPTGTASARSRRTTQTDSASATLPTDSLEKFLATRTVSSLRDAVSDGRFFGVKFVKRTDGQMRTMTCRLGVQAPPPSSGQHRSWDPEPRGLLNVYDAGKRGFRMIPVENIVEIAIRGVRRAVGHCSQRGGGL